MPYEDPLKEYFEQDPERKLKVFKLYTKVLVFIPLILAFGVIMFILIQFKII